MPLFAFLFCVLYNFMFCCGEPIRINLGQQQGYFQGDIIAHEQPNEAEPGLNNQTKPKVRSGVTKGRLWENNIIYYELGPAAWNQKHFDMLATALKEIEDNTCVRFEKRVKQQHYVRIENSSGCYSAVGQSAFGMQSLSLMDTRWATCWVHDTVVHELLHAVGLYHEQMRPDRDQHIYIFMNNVDEGKEANFIPCTKDQCNNYGVPYNYLSVMHYDITAFSSTKRATMLPKDIAFASALGRAETGHPLDYETVRRMYSCPRKNVTCYQCETSSKDKDCSYGQCRGDVCYTSVWSNRLIKGCGDAMYTLIGCRNGDQVGEHNTICGCKTDWCNGNLTVHYYGSQSCKTSVHIFNIIFAFLVAVLGRL